MNETKQRKGKMTKYVSHHKELATVDMVGWGEDLIGSEAYAYNGVTPLCITGYNEENDTVTMLELDEDDQITNREVVAFADSVYLIDVDKDMLFGGGSND